MGEDREIGPGLIAGIQREIAIAVALLPGQGANGHAMRIAGESIRRVGAARLLLCAAVGNLVEQRT